MRFAFLAASTAVLALSSTAALAQEAAAEFENVYLDVDGAAIQVPVALAAQACGLDEAAVREAAATRLEESGIDPAVLQAATSSPNAQDVTTAQGANEATADAGAVAGETTSTGETSDQADIASTEGAASLTETLEDAETTAAETTAGEEALVTPESNETVTTAQGTADPSTTAPGDEMLALAVCQIDVATAADLGIPQANEIVTD